MFLTFGYNRGEACQAETVQQTFELFLTPEMIELIVKHSNEEGGLSSNCYKKQTGRKCHGSYRKTQRQWAEHYHKHTGVECEDLVKRLHDDHNLTMVGTVQKNMQHILEEMKEVKGRDPKTCLFTWDSPAMLESHIPKLQKNVMVYFPQCTDSQTSFNMRITPLRLSFLKMRPNVGRCC